MQDAGDVSAWRLNGPDIAQFQHRNRLACDVDGDYKPTMYQMIEDPDEGVDDSRPGLPIWPFVVGLGGAVLVFTAVWLVSPGAPADSPLDVETPEARTAYLKALSEPLPSLRRARLMDFQNAYPDSDRAGAVRDHLTVINAAEVQDWSALTRAVYDVRAEENAKLESLTAYEVKWGSRLLGGRGEELDALRAEVSQIEDAQPLPDRTLDPGVSPIPDNVPSDVLAGGPQIAPPVIFVPPPPIEEPEVVKKVDLVVQPTVRRDFRPRYPRKAQRRKIDGTVVLALSIDARGRVSMTDVVSVEADRYAKDFVKAAERAALKLRFNPKTVNGEAVPAQGIRKRYLFRSNN